MSTTSPCCWCDPLPCRQALDRSRSQSKLRYSPRIGKKSATDPGILLSFSSSEKPQKCRKHSHTNVSDALVARSSTPPAQTPQRSFQQASAGVLLSSANRLICLKYAEGAPHTARGKPFPKRFQITLAQTPQRSFQGAAAGTHATPAPNRAHSGLHGETRGVLDGGWYHYPRSVLRGSETLRGRVSERQTLPLLGLGQGAPEERREPVEQRCAHARRCPEASRPRWAAWSRCCFSCRIDGLRGFSQPLRWHTEN